MNTSEVCKAVILALVAVQEEMTVFRDGTNPHFNSKYATLDSILTTIKPVLKDQGLVAMQTMQTVEKQITCVTRIFHESGEWVESEATVHAEQDKPQKYGSAITYARRYGLATALGIGLMDDDDGAQAEAVVTEKMIADHLRRIKQKAIPRFKEMKIECVVKAFEESEMKVGEGLEEPDVIIVDLLRQVKTEDDLIKIGKRAKELNEDDSGSDQTPPEEKDEPKPPVKKKKAAKKAPAKKAPAKKKKPKAEEKAEPEEKKEESTGEDDELITAEGPSGSDVDWANKPAAPEGDEVASDEWCEFILSAFHANVEQNLTFEHLDAYLDETIEGDFEVGIWKENAKDALGALYVNMASDADEHGHIELSDAFPKVFA